MHCISTIHVFSYSVVKVLSLEHGPRLFFQFPVEAAISDQKAPVLLLPASGLNRCLGVIKRKIYIKKSGTRLFFHIVSNIVPSAVQVLTVVFGMGTGVAPARIGTRLIYLFIQIYDTLTEMQPLLLSLERR